MTTWIIEPRDPLIARDGRPFDLTPGARARSLGFPFPSTTTGAFRTRLGQDATGAFVAQGDALEFVKTREKDDSNPLLDHLAEAVHAAGWDGLVQDSETEDLEQYMWLTRETLAALLWYKRFAQSLPEVAP